MENQTPYRPPMNLQAYHSFHQHALPANTRDLSMEGFAFAQSVTQDQQASDPHLNFGDQQYNHSLQPYPGDNYTYGENTIHEESTSSVIYNADWADYKYYPPIENGYTQPSYLRFCANCGTTETSQWRKEPGTDRTLCNPCGLYFRTRRFHRPRELIEADRDEYAPPYQHPGDSALRCSHCQRQNTPAWRRGPNGELLCNACGMYLRTNHRSRPLELQKSEKIRPRLPSRT